MFKLDMQALREAAHVPPPVVPVQLLAKLAISQPTSEESFDLLAARLMTAAMRRCDQFSDGDKARQDMREQVLETPSHLHQILLDYFVRNSLLKLCII